MQIDELKAMSSPPRERGKNFWLTADVDALNGLTEALSEAVCVEQHLDGKVLRNQLLPIYFTKLHWELKDWPSNSNDWLLHLLKGITIYGIT